jgi:arylsulfatase
LVLLDDVGFGDSSTFGGPVQTPELDKLAAQGLRYNRFHVSALCSPTRAALLSGRNDHRAAFGTVTDAATGFPGYNGIWRKDTVTIAEVLRRNGYNTAAFGKWHNTPYWEISPVGPFDRWPTGLGFEYFYGFMGGQTSQWEPTLYRNTVAVETSATSPEEYHLTTDLVDEAIRWLHTHDSLAPERPFFIYFATGAVHLPHQAPREWIDKYRGHFNGGWDRLREETFARQKALGVIPADAELTPRPEELPAWDSLSAEKRLLLARQMEVYAGFLAHTDHEVGRLINAIKKGPRAENTLILYVVGDNGAAAGGLEGSDDSGDPFAATTVQARLREIGDLGGPRFWNIYATAWAWASDTPFQSTKEDASHLGGTRDPLVVSWPARINDAGGLRTQFTHVNDIAPTIYEVTGIRFPTERDGVKQQSLDGTSFVYSFEKPSAPSRHRTQIFEQSGNRAIYQDGWLAAAPHCLPWKCPYQGANLYDFEKDHWELYHIDTDFSEAHDLSARYPGKLKQLRELFDAEARRNNVYPLLAMALKNQPGPPGDRRKFVYYRGLPRTPLFVVPNFSASHRITAEVEIPQNGVEGVIIAAGSRYAGFALYIKGNRLVYENHWFGGHRDVIASQMPLPHGNVVLVYEFKELAKEAKEVGGGVSATAEEAKTGDSELFENRVVPGIGRLYVNGKLVAERRQGPVLSWVLDYRPHGTPEGGDLGIGQAFAPVSTAFKPPFTFSGALTKVIVELE